MKRTCPDCASELPDDPLLCPGCGAAQPHAEASPGRSAEVAPTDPLDTDLPQAGPDPVIAAKAADPAGATLIADSPGDDPDARGKARPAPGTVEDAQEPEDAGDTGDLEDAALGEGAEPEAGPDANQGELFTPAPAPSFLRGETPSVVASRGSGIGWWWAAAAALLVALALQWLWVERDRLAQEPRWRPLVQSACALMRCRLPTWHQPEAIQITARDVRPHPSVDGALLITATFRNDAPHPQAWPQLELTLSDLDGSVIGRRRFEVGEYLGGEPPQSLLQSGQSARVTLEVVDAGREAIAFSFAFR